MSDPSTHEALAELTAQVRLLTDRAAISDLLVEFARTLDERDWEANTELYLPDGEFILGETMRLQGHDQLRRTGSPHGLGQYAGTWHLSSNHAITVDGDQAHTRSYLLGVHLLRDDQIGDDDRQRDAHDEDLFRHADGGGWYDCTLRRTPVGWRFATVRIHEIWRSGLPLPHVAPPS